MSMLKALDDFDLSAFSVAHSSGAILALPSKRNSIAGGLVDAAMHSIA
jgi:hypothetical protein|tara:strand:- start:17132 stop:17275 length:144 start_codon:yes stop_codon:yes gene_type:complete